MINIASEKKASIQLLGPRGDPIGQPIAVQFNPEKYAKSWDLNWSPNKQFLQWTETTPGPFIITLNFDSYEERTNVLEKTKEIKKLINPSKDPKPTGCIFQWGKVAYKGVVKSIKEECTLFLNDGTPVRCQLTLTLNSWPEEVMRGMTKLKTNEIN